MYGPTWKSSISTTRSPSAPRITTRAFAAEQTADRSSAASAWHSEPPIVPQLRTTGSAITRSASANSGKRRAKQLGFEQLGVAGERTDSDLAVLLTDVRELAELVDVDQVLGVGQAQFHHRQQAVPAGDDPCLRSEPSERLDYAVDARPALVLEWSRGLHLYSPLTGRDGSRLRGAPTSSRSSYWTGESAPITGERGRFSGLSWRTES